MGEMIHATIASPGEEIQARKRLLRFMKNCPYCAAENRDDAAVCYFCGYSLGTAPFSPPGNQSQTEPTQPVRARVYPPQPAAPGPSDTQQVPFSKPAAPQSYDTQRIPYSPPPPAGSGSGYTTSPYPPAYGPPPAYIPPPPPPPASYNRGSNRLGLLLLLGLGAVLLFVCGLAVWTLTSATNAGAARLRAQISGQLATQSAGILRPPLVNPAMPTSPAQPAAPTPWPTFTPLPTVAPPPTQPPAAANPTADATQAIVMEKLLSPGCKNALDALSKLSDQVSTTPTAVLDGGWRSNFSQAMVDMKTNCGTLDAASPVPGLISQAHQDLANAQSEFDQAGKLFNEGMKNLDPNKLLEAGQHVQQAAKDLNAAIAELKKIGKEWCYFLLFLYDSNELIVR